ncbi:MAG: rhodanese-like domain-containing protein [Acidobacteriota bacterium]
MTDGARGVVRRVRGDEAAALLTGGGLTVLDVRTPDEHTRLGHLPGSRLLPVDLMMSAPAVLPDDDGPLLVYCEHGVRSAHAATVLAAAGYGPIYDLAGGMAEWRGAREFSATPVNGPAGWLLENGDLLRAGMRVLDVAAGRGRHALLLAGAGLTVTAIDRDVAKMARLAAVAGRLDLAITTRVRDLEAGEADLGDGAFDFVIVTNYLHRPLMPALVRAVAAGGVLLYETFTRAQAERGRPTNPAYLLEPGELVGLVAPLQVVRQREGDVDGRMVASVAAVNGPRPAP